MLRPVVERTILASLSREMAVRYRPSPTKETQAEANVIREVLTVTMVTNDELDQLLQKWNLWNTIRVGSWVARFIRNFRVRC